MHFGCTLVLIVPSEPSKIGYVMTKIYVHELTKKESWHRPHFPMSLTLQRYSVRRKDGFHTSLINTWTTFWVRKLRILNMVDMPGLADPFSWRAQQKYPRFKKWNNRSNILRSQSHTTMHVAIQHFVASMLGCIAEREPRDKDSAVLQSNSWYDATHLARSLLK